MGIIVFAGKNVSTRAKYFSTTRKKDFYRQTHMFPLMGITYPVLAKNSFTGKNMFPFVGNIFLLMDSQSLNAIINYV